MEQFQAPGAGQSIHWSLRALYLPLLRSEETPHYLGHWLRPPSRINVRLLLGYFTMSIVSPHAHCGRHVIVFIETCIAVISLSSAAFIPTSPESRIVATFEWKDANLERKSVIKDEATMSEKDKK